MKDFSSLESKIRKLMTGRLCEGGWERKSDTLWIHPIAEIARVIDTDGHEHYLNKAGEKVNFVEDNSAKRMSEPNVGRPNTAKNALDTKSKLLKQAEIKTKIIDEVKRVLDYMVERSPTIDPKSKKDDKKDKSPTADPKAKDDTQKVDKKEEKVDRDNQDNKDPKEIKGGKSEVDTDPTTDDKIPDESKETKDSKKAASDENKKIGKKSTPVKEEALDEIRSRDGDGKPIDPKKVHISIKDLPKKKEKTDIRSKEQKKHDSWDKFLSGKSNYRPGSKKKPTKEDFSADELAYFDVVMAEAYVDMSKKKCDEIINAKGKPHKVYTATDETRHGIGVDELKRHLGVGDSDHVHKKFMHNLHTAGVRTGWSHSAGKWIAYHGPKV